jgi:phage replication-related protein YjqB (UPF0714/DUF867 family)
VRVRRSGDESAIYTVGEGRTENSEDIVRMGLAGRQRLGVDGRFDATFDTQVVHPTLSEVAAEEQDEFIERLHDDGQNTELLVLAPHGGDIEVHTDDQARLLTCELVGNDVSTWLCKGFHSSGAYATWHITSADIEPASFPLLSLISTRRFTHAVAFHGFAQDEILVGGSASAALKDAIVSAVKQAVTGSGIQVRVALPSDKFGGDDPNNIVNRLTVGGAGGIQIEQSLAARNEYWDVIAEAVAGLHRNL